MASQLKGVLFDLDDTLIDWSGVKLGWREIESARMSRVQAYIYRKLNTFVPEVEQIQDLYLRLVREAWSEARMTLRAPLMPDILMSTLRKLGVDTDKLDQDEVILAYDWNVVPGTVVFPDVPPMLQLLRSLNIKLGIVTNASQPMTMRDAELRAHDLIDYFPDCRLSAADSGYLKPHPRIFEDALELIGVTADEAIFIGDNPVADIDGARSAGMRAVRRLNARATADGNLTESHRCLRTLDELPEILDEWYPGWRNGGA